MRGEKQLYIWSAVPPSDKFVALGMIATTSPQPPPLDAMHCVPMEWCAPPHPWDQPVLVWESTMGSKPGAIWRVGSLGLLWVTQTASTPPDGILSLRNPGMILSQVTLPATLLEKMMPSSSDNFMCLIVVSQ